MPRGNRSTVLALGLVVFALFGVAVGGYLYWDASRLESQYQRQTDNKAKEYRDRAHIRIERRCRHVPPEAIRQCVYEEYNAAEQGDHDQTDLQAQLVTSAWTRAMGIAAILGMAVGIVGVGLVFITFHETRIANEIARAAALDATRIGEAQVRCYLTATRASIRLSQDGFFQVAVSLHNSGQSPAQKIEIKYDATLSAFSRHRPHKGVQLKSSNLSNYRVAAGADVDIPPQTCSEAITTDMLEILKTEEDSAFWCLIFFEFNWLDVFDVKLRTVEGFHVLYESNPFDRDIPLESGDFMIARLRSDYLRGKYKHMEEGGESAEPPHEPRGPK